MDDKQDVDLLVDFLEQFNTGKKLSWRNGTFIDSFVECVHQVYSDSLAHVDFILQALIQLKIQISEKEIKETLI